MSDMVLAHPSMLSRNATSPDADQLQASSIKFSEKIRRLHSSSTFLERKASAESVQRSFDMADDGAHGRPAASLQSMAPGRGMSMHEKSFSSMVTSRTSVQSMAPESSASALKTIALAKRMSVSVSRSSAVKHGGNLPETHRRTLAPRHQMSMVDLSEDIDEVADNLLEKRERASDANISQIVSVIMSGNSKLLSIFNETELRVISAGSAIRRITGNQLLMSQGEASTSMYIVLSGTFDVLVDFTGKRSIDNAEKVDTSGIGSAIGEIGMITGERRTAFIRSQQGVCEVLDVNFETIKGVTLRRPGLDEELIQIVKENKKELLRKRKKVKEQAEQAIITKVETEVNKLQQARKKAKEVKIQKFQGRIQRAHLQNKEVEMHNKVETLKLQMQESLQSTFVVAWPMIEMKNDSDARTHMNLKEILEDNPAVRDVLHSQRGQTILHKAASIGAVRLCATIIKCGASVDTNDPHGKTALHYAIEGANARGQGKGLLTVRIILAAGATQTRTFLGESPMDMCQRDDVRLLLHNHLHERQLSHCSVEGCMNGSPSIVCDRCKLVKYCCLEHKTSDWDVHKLVCRAPPPQARQDEQHPARTPSGTSREEMTTFSPLAGVAGGSEIIGLQSLSLASFRTGRPNAKARPHGALSELAQSKIERLHEKTNDKILGRNWQIYEKGVKMEHMHRVWVLKDWMMRWNRYLWISRAIIAIAYRDEMSDFVPVNEVGLSPKSLLHKCGASVFTGTLPNSPYYKYSEHGAWGNGRHGKQRGYNGGGWHELEAFAAARSEGPEKPPVTLLEAPRALSERGGGWIPRDTLPRKGGGWGQPPSATPPPLPTRGKAPSPRKPAKTPRGQSGAGGASVGGPLRARALKTASFSLGGDSIIGSRTREEILSQIKRAMSESNSAASSVKHGGLGQGEGDSVSAEVDDQGPLGFHGDMCDSQTTFERSSTFGSGRMLRHSSRGGSPIATREGSPIAKRGGSPIAKRGGSPIAIEGGSDVSTASKSKPDLWGNVFGLDKQEKEEKSRMLDSKLIKGASSGAKVSLFLDKRLCDATSGRRESISSLTGGEELEKLNMASVVLDHMENFDEETKAIVLEKIGFHAGSDADADAAVLAAMSTAEFDDFLDSKGVPKRKEILPKESKEEMVVKTITRVKNGTIRFDELSIEELQDICDIGWDISKRHVQHTRKPVADAVFGTTPKLRFASFAVRKTIEKADMQHLIDPLGSPLDRFYAEDSQTGVKSRFKGVVFPSFKDAYHNHDTDSD